MPEVVYHGSPERGLVELTPSESTHGKSWVYATRHLPVAAIQLQPGGDLTCSHGLRDGTVYLYERWPGAFQARYGGKPGAIYELPGATFQAGLTSFTGEVVSDEPVSVLCEHRVADAALYLYGLAEQGSLELFMHDKRPSWIPPDDRDLLDRIVRWSHGNPRSGVVKYAAEHLPHLMEQIGRHLGANPEE